MPRSPQRRVEVPGARLGSCRFFVGPRGRERRPAPRFQPPAAVEPPTAEAGVTENVGCGGGRGARGAPPQEAAAVLRPQQGSAPPQRTLCRQLRSQVQSPSFWEGGLVPPGSRGGRFGVSPVLVASSCSLPERSAPASVTSPPLHKSDPSAGLQTLCERGT